MGRQTSAGQNKRRERLEATQRAQEKISRRRRTNFIIAGVATVVAVSLILVAVISTNKPSSSKLAIPGVQTFSGLGTKHVTGHVTYAQTPPVGGDHSAVWLNCAVYGQPVPNENAVHSMEHGAVWVTYDPAVVKDGQLSALRQLIPSTYVILSPYPGLPAPVIASAWGAQLKLTGVTDPRIIDFINKYRESKSAPEPGAPCSGGLTGPGKVS